MDELVSDLETESVVDLLAGMEGLDTLSRSDIQHHIIPLIHISRFNPGQRIIGIRTLNHAMYILYRGRMRVEVSFGGSKKNIYLEPGAIFGEMAVVKPQRPTRANVYADDYSTLLSIDIESFQSVMRQNVSIIRAFAILIGKRVVRLTTQN
ncbi:MAG: cyclic nucleotide-binding domain-containing protein [Magnetococcales bacterium]|nr:cyclic nucleotide-binding domain-containing protein [Magnetococcales bacterium]